MTACLNNLSKIPNRVENRLPGMKRPLKPIPVFRQNPGESQKRFFNRMERTAKGVIERSKYEDKYGVEVKQDEVTGETSVRDREKDEIDLAAEQGGDSRRPLRPLRPIQDI